MPVWDWTDPVAVVGSATVDLVGQAARLELTEIPDYIGTRPGAPVRYVRAGSWGWVAGDVYGPPVAVEWQDGWLVYPPEGATGVWVYLSDGFEADVWAGTLAPGHELGSGRLAGEFVDEREPGWFQLG